jgi:serine/tyrosine/threonine adenylyltransferase
MLEDTSCDFNHFFYRLGNTPIYSLKSKDDYLHTASQILPHDTQTEKALDTLAEWMETKYKPRLDKESSNDESRQKIMNQVNPKFVLRQWILQEVIEKTRSEKDVGVKDKELLDLVLKMSLEPFKQSWGVNEEEETRLCGDVPQVDRGFQCSCSS